jgi:hypothetical protein
MFYGTYESAVILSGVRPTEGRANEAKDLYDIEKILRFAGLRSASSGYAQNDMQKNLLNQFSTVYSTVTDFAKFLG